MQGNNHCYISELCFWGRNRKGADDTRAPSGCQGWGQDSQASQLLCLLDANTQDSSEILSFPGTRYTLHITHSAAGHVSIQEAHGADAMLLLILLAWRQSLSEAVSWRTAGSLSAPSANPSSGARAVGPHWHCPTPGGV